MSLSGASSVVHSLDASDTPCLAGLTTKPIIDRSPRGKRVHGNMPQPRSLENIDLSVEEIKDMFFIVGGFRPHLLLSLNPLIRSRYFRHYHPYLPFLSPDLSPHDCYEQSELLFWSIISVASRHLENQPTLLTSLARAVTDLLWRTLRSIPYSLQVVQSLILLCTWPFPTSSSTADPTYMLVGIMVQTGTQMGLHRARNAQDFNKVPLKLEGSEYDEWIRTWQACGIVAQR